MTETKITFIIVSIVVFIIYRVYFAKLIQEEEYFYRNQENNRMEIVINPPNHNDSEVFIAKPKTNVSIKRDLPNFMINSKKYACHIYDVFAIPDKVMDKDKCYSSENKARSDKIVHNPKDSKQKKRDGGNSAAFAATGIVIILVLSVFKSLHDVIKVKRQEKTAAAIESELSRRCSLAEFANLRHTRKESNINNSTQINHVSRKDSILCNANKTPSVCRMDSTNSYLCRNRKESVVDGIAPLASGTDSPNSAASIARTPLKLLGARPPPLLRRSSFPVAPHADSAQRRGSSVDSEDDSSPDSRRRVRLIRRY